MRVRYAVTLALLVGCTSTEGSDIPTPPPNASQPTLSTAAPPSPSKPDPALVPPELAKYCRSGFPLEGVWSPHRLTVKERCVAVTGVASTIKREHDGDMHISLTGVDPKWLNEVNLQRSNQSLVVEVVPSIPMTMPPLGSRVRIVGPWVLDTQTGWLEIHPVWAILPA
ncbi:MAG: hypothetical protein ABIQ09_04075 [Jatrophihabitantaceae bacterium]